MWEDGVYLGIRATTGEINAEKWLQTRVVVSKFVFVRFSPWVGSWKIDRDVNDGGVALLPLR